MKKFGKKFGFLFLLFMSFIINVYASEFEELTVNNQEVKCSGYNCEVLVDAKVVTIKYKLSDNVKSASPDSGHQIELTSDTTVNISMILEDGTPANYYIKIVKYVPSSDYTLSSLKINGEEVELIKDVYVYSFDVLFDAETIEIVGVPNDKNAKCSPLEVAFPIDSSSKQIQYLVTAPDGTKKNWTLNIKRKNKPDTTLKSLTLSDIDLEFSSSKYEYNVVVPYRINNTKIEALANAKTAKVEIINPESFIVGDNEIRIKVTNENVTDEYVIKVKRLEDIDESILNLKKLEVRGCSLSFNPKKYDYTLKFTEIPSKLSLIITPNDDTEYEVIDNENLTDGSVVSIVVKHENGLSKTYSLKVVKDSALKEAVKYNKTLLIILIIILIIAMVVLLILQLKEKDNKLKKVAKKSKTTKKNDDIELI